MGVYDYHRADELHRPPEVTRENPYKVYVAVMVQFTAAGEMVPLSITWEDGRHYEIDQIQDVARMASRRAGGAGVRYLCRVLGNPVELYYEENGLWFVTRRQ